MDVDSCFAANSKWWAFDVDGILQQQRDLGHADIRKFYGNRVGEPRAFSI